MIEYVEKGNTKKVRELMAMGVEPGSVKKDGVPLIVLAADLNYTAMVKLLLTADTEVDAYDSHFETALYKGAYHGNKMVVKFLANEGAYLDLCGRLNRTPLIWAVFKRHRDLAKMLVRLGADVSISDLWQNTARDYALDQNDEELADLLL